jgi:hypothetical protein
LPLVAVCLLAAIGLATHRAHAAPVKSTDFQELDAVIAAQTKNTAYRVLRWQSSKAMKSPICKATEQPGRAAL